MNKKFTKQLIIFFLILSSCVFEDDLLRNTREDYLGDNLCLDGFYYYYDEGKIRGVKFLYRNGVSFEVIGDDKERTKPEEVHTLLTKDRLERLKMDKDMWGIFNIKGNNISLETWRIMSGNHHSVIYSGAILNDTTFIITKRDHANSGVTNANYTYYFYPYSPKPDSTNTFIK
jgi:hypothetical protein